MPRMLMAIAAAVLLMPGTALASSHIMCSRTTITKIQPPAGPYGYQTGVVSFANKTFALLPGTMTDHVWEKMREGDHVQVCVSDIPIGGHHYPISVVDFDGNVMFNSTFGAEGA